MCRKTAIKQICRQLTPEAYYTVDQSLFLHCSFVKIITRTPAGKIHTGHWSVYCEIILTTNNFYFN